MLRTIASRLRQEERGYTLIELMLTLVVLGILVSIAVPSYLSIKDRANKNAAEQNLQAVVADVETYNTFNYIGAPLAKDPDWNGVDGAGSGTNADSGYDSTWVGHDVVSRLKAKYDPSISTADFHWDPAGWAPSAGLSTATDYCLYTLVGTYYAAKHGTTGAITAGTTLNLGADGTCTAS